MLAGDSVPSIDPVADLSIHEDAGLQIISLSGISEGEGTPESVRISASSDNLELVDHPEVTHQPGQATGEIRLEPKPNAHGVATIEVLVEDAGADNDFQSTADNGHTSMTFTLEVSSVNDAPTLSPVGAIAFEINEKASLISSSPFLEGLDYGDSHPGSVFSSSIDMTSDGTGLIVGASSGTDSEVGYVEVYHRVNELSPWIQHGQQLVGDSETVLGRAVSLNDDSTRIAISTGRAVSVMQHDDGQDRWIPLGAPITQYGIISSVDLDSTGDLLALATADSDGIPNAQLYRFDGTQWVQEQGNLTMGQDVNEDVKNQVAQSYVAINQSGTHLLHAISGCGCTGKGFAQVYSWDIEDSQWMPMGNRIEGEGSYGSAVDISDDGMVVAIGAPQLGTEADLFGNGLVEVLSFDTNSGQWSSLGNPIAGTSNGQQLGKAVSLSADGRTLVIGSSGASSESVNAAGKVSILNFNDQIADWEITQEHYGPDANATFGWKTAVNATGSSLVIGARGGTSSPNRNGKLFSLSEGHAVALDGITPGGGEDQSVRITAVTDQPQIAGQPITVHADGASTAQLLFQPELDQPGIALIEVQVEDPGEDGDFTTYDDNGISQRVFSFGVGLSSFEESAGTLTLDLGKTSTDVQISRTNEGTTLQLQGDRWLGTATDDILIPDENRMILPALQQFNRVELVLDGERDLVFQDVNAWRVGTPLILGERFLKSVTQADNAQEVIYVEDDADWQNPIEPSDINMNGYVSASDALQIINELAANVYSDPSTGILMDPRTLESWPNRAFDHDANGRVSAMDALRVINHMASLQNDENAEGEAFFSSPLSISSNGPSIESKNLTPRPSLSDRPPNDLEPHVVKRTFDHRFPSNADVDHVQSGSRQENQNKEPSPLTDISTTVTTSVDQVFKDWQTISPQTTTPVETS